MTSTVSAVVGYASSSISDESCGAYFDRQVALIEGAVSFETAAATAGSEPKESTSEAILINTALQESPTHHIESGNTRDSSMEVESAESAGPQSPAPSLTFRFNSLKSSSKSAHYSTGHRSYKPKNPNAKVTIADFVTVPEPSASSAEVLSPRTRTRPKHISHESQLTSTSDVGE